MKSLAMWMEFVKDSMSVIDSGTVTALGLVMLWGLALVTWMARKLEHATVTESGIEKASL